MSYSKTSSVSVYGVTAAGGKNYRYYSYGNMTERGSTLNKYDVANKPIQLDNRYFTYGPDDEKYKYSTATSPPWT